MSVFICRHCHRFIEQDDEGRWIDPEATGDDSVWRETCDSHDTFEANHEPIDASPPCQDVSMAGMPRPQVVSTPVPVEVPDVKLNATDRCDRCGAQAYVKTEHAGRSLLWCAHHYGENEQKLRPHKVVDELHMLDPKASAASV